MNDDSLSLTSPTQDPIQSTVVNEDQSLMLPRGPSPIPPAPTNAEQVAGQLTLANDPPDYKAGIMKYLEGIHQYGQDTYHKDIWEARKQEEVQTAHDMAADRVLQNDPQGASDIMLGINEKYKELVTPTKAATASAAQALENVATGSIPYHDNVESLTTLIDANAEKLATTNLIGQKISEAIQKTEADSGILNSITDFAGMMVPFGHYLATIKLADQTGGGGFNKYNSLKQLMNTLVGLKPDQQDAFIKQATEAALGPFGLTKNPNATIRFLRQLLDYSQNEFLFETALDATNIGLIGDAFAVTRALAKAGKTVVGVANTAGKETAGKILAGDVTSGTSITGLNDAEKVSSSLAMGRMPHELDPSSMSGLSAQAQDALRDSQKTLYDNLKTKLQSSGLTEAEVQQQLADIRTKYDPVNNREISSVIFGTGDELGQDMTVYMQSRDGRSFVTKEAAEARAKELGLTNYTIVDKATPETAPIKANYADDLGGMLEDMKIELENKKYLAQEKRSKEGYDEAADHEATLKMIEQAQKMLKAGKEDTAEFTNLMGELEEFSYRSVDDEIGLPLFQDGNREIGASLDKRVSGFGNDLAKLFGLGDHNFVLGSFDDVLALKRRSFGINSMQDNIANLKGGAKGAWTFLEDEQAHVIMVDPKLPLKTQVITMAHEMGHAFDAQVLRANPAIRKAMAAGFEDFLKTKGMSIGPDFNEFLAKRLTLEDRPAVVEGIMDGSVQSLGDLPKNFEVWTKRFDEYFADQFQKFAFTDARPVSIVDKYFKGLVDKLKEAYKYVAKVLGLSKEDVMAPRAGIERFLKDYLENPNKFKVASNITMDGLKKAATEGSTKPRIKLKLPNQDKIAGDPVGYLIKTNKKDPLGYATGQFSEKDILSANFIAVDPKHGASQFLVEERVIGVHQEAKMRKDLSDYIKPFYDKLSGVEKERVASILREGDAYGDVSGATGKEFSANDLKIRGLNENEISAYLATRSLRMITWQLRNADQVRHLTALGHQELTLTRVIAGEGRRSSFVAKKVDGKDLLGKLVFDSRSNSPYRITEKTLEDMNKSGAYVAELYQPEKFDGKFYRHVIGHPDHTGMKNITTAIPYRPGEFSRIYTDEYFIKVRRATEIDGEADGWIDTIRTARSKREAEEYIHSMKNAVAIANSVSTGKLVVKNYEGVLEKTIGQYMDPRDFIKAHAEGEFNDITHWDWNYTRSRDEYLNGSIAEAVSSGRTFTSRRGERIFSVDKRRDNTLDVYKSIQAEMANVSRVQAISQWRENSIRRWMNTFGDLIPNRTGNDVADFFKAANVRFARRGEGEVFAERTHKYIMRQIGVKTSEESMYESFTRSLTERFFTGGERLEAVGAFVRQQSFLGFLRNVNFNLTLGMWNPAQLIVQANGAATAIALSTRHGLAAAKTFPLLRMALMSDKPEVWSKLASAQKLSDLGLSSKEDFVKLVESIRKTGIIDNLKSTSLWNIEDGSMDLFGGYGSKVWGTQAAFFNRGEEFSRIVSFDVARREWQAANAEKDWASSAALKEIVKRADDLTQNMTKANLAAFQTGIVSIPAQFLQYNIKLAGNIASSFLSNSGRGFTRAEAARLMAAHLVLYGAAGTGTTWVANEMLGNHKEELSVTQKNYISQGLMAGLIDSMSMAFTGKHTSIAVGSRLGSFDFYQRIGDAIFTDPASIYTVLLGPTAATAERVGSAAEVAALWWKQPDLSPRDILEGLSTAATAQISTLRNATKAYIYYTNEGKMVDKKGNAIGNVNQSEMLAQALGFQPSVAIDVYAMYKSKKDHDTTMRELGDTIYSVQKDIIFQLQKGTEDGRERAAQKKKLLQALWPDNGGDMEQVQRYIKDKLYPYDDQFQKLIADHLYKDFNYEQPLTVTKEPNPAAYAPTKGK